MDRSNILDDESSASELKQNPSAEYHSPSSPTAEQASSSPSHDPSSAAQSSPETTSLADTLASLSLSSSPSENMFRSLASLFQASQVHEGGIILNQPNGNDIWTILHRADQAEARGERDVSALRSVRGVLDQMLWARSQLLTPVTRTMADAGRDPSWRVAFGEGEILNFALTAIASSNTSEDLQTQSLRLIGNSCADTDENRYRVVSNYYLQMIMTRMEDHRLAPVAIPVVYNICNDYEPAQRQAITAGLFPTIIRLLRSEMVDSTPAFAYVCRLLDVCSDGLDPAQSPENTVEVLLQASIKRDLDVDDFASLVDVAVLHLQAEVFQRHIVTNDFFDLTLKALVRSFFPQANLAGARIPPISSMATVVRAPEEEAELTRIRKSLISSISDISALEEFSTIHSSLDTPLIGTLVIWLSSSCAQIQLCSCLILGNLAQSDDVCRTIVNRLTLHKDLITLLRSSSDSQVVHSVLGFLRNLALPTMNKDSIGDSGAIEALTRFLSSDSLPQVSYAAVCLARQLIIGNLKNIKRLLAPLSTDEESPASSKTYLSILLALYEKADDVGVKTEVARIVAAILRGFHSFESLNKTVRDQFLLQLYALHPNIGQPLGMMVAQSRYPVIRSEGWFAMALMARSSEGAAIINKIISEVNIFTALEDTIRGTGTSPQSSSTTTPVTDSNSPLSPLQTARPNDMRSRDRENALILVNELLQHGDEVTMAEPNHSALEELLQTGSLADS